MTEPERQNLIGMARIEMQSFFASLGAREFHARQVLRWVYQRGVNDFSQMTDLSKVLRDQLQQLAQISVPETVTVRQSSDSTRKWLLRLEDGNCIETVFIPEDDRGTLCVSAQVGCSLNCTFCATARQGFSRNLTTAEIIGQL
ncbi:MAG TPA: bifunctional tRNA (adenosine(37)-C2)-methyltransferase TrmG/ribosomal RNA large subunit methyltransferase RlmN, partial [Gammaproteobacteria bacterium]|nr:bifunctional tRNA (adenosine(37)-C2)-methyltransferase TrmG/ribosomal RNA large subunit methyltransferase RlmN [Gammaproteobacteria bacterium]